MKDYVDDDVDDVDDDDDVDDVDDDKVDNVDVDDEMIRRRRRSRRSYENEFCRRPVGKRPSQELSGKNSITVIYSKT